MRKKSQHRESKRLLVCMPSWVGDAVMATPTLRALDHLYPQAHITALTRATVRPVVEACPWIDRIMTVLSPRRGKSDAFRNGILSLSRRLASKKYDTAVLLPNSFRSALTVMLAGIPRRVGYDRDGRGFLLTDRLLPRRNRGSYVPVPTRDYYLGLARYLGATDVDYSMRLFTKSEHDQAVDDLLAQPHFDWPNRPLVLIMPGASYGSAKMWPADRFAALADRCTTQLHANVAISGAPKERAVLDRVLAAAQEPVHDLLKLGIDLSRFKSMVNRCSLVITNDTGPRHIAAALGVPVISIFGPTDPAWTEIGFAQERQVQIDVECGPCQLKQCPLDHRCMKWIDVDTVFDHAVELLGFGRVRCRPQCAVD